jgi:hypothetical protein
MINDRDLGIIGAGAFLTVLCLLFKWPFVIRVVVGLLILVTFMILALLRLGPDREPIEVHLARWLNILRSPRKFVLGGGQVRSRPGIVRRTRADARPDPVQAPAPGVPVPVPSRSNAPATSGLAISIKPVTLALEEVGVYHLVTVLLAVIGLYFIFWLVQGGTGQIGHWMRTMFRIP